MFPLLFWVAILLACSRMHFLFEQVPEPVAAQLLIGGELSVVVAAVVNQLQQGRLAADERNTAIHLAEQLAEQRQAFMQHMSHEMRTPLNVRGRRLAAVAAAGKDSLACMCVCARVCARCRACWAPRSC